MKKIMKLILKLDMRIKCSLCMLLAALVIFAGYYLICKKQYINYMLDGMSRMMADIRSHYDVGSQEIYKKDYHDYFAPWYQEGKNDFLMIARGGVVNESRVFFSCSEGVYEEPVLLREYCQKRGAPEAYFFMVRNVDAGTFRFRFDQKRTALIYIRDLEYNLIIAYTGTDFAFFTVRWRLFLGVMLLLLSEFAVVAAFYVYDQKNQKELNEKLQEAYRNIHDKEQQYEIISDLMNEFIFEFDFRRDILELSEKYQKVFQRGRHFLRFMETIGSRYTIFHQDIKNIRNAHQQILEGREISEVIFRLQMSTGGFEWFSAMFKVMTSGDGKPLKAVGKLQNIQKAQSEKALLQTRSTKDPLTGLLNRAEFERLSTEYMEGMGDHDMAAMIIMDLDHFKQVNDTFGHVKGDELLKEVASVLHNTFRRDDLVARLGGDEFFIMMRDIQQKDNAVEKCQALLDSLTRDVTHDGKAVRIGCSIGLLFVKPHQQFLDLYMKVDSTLYSAKKNGRGQYRIYEEL